MTQEASLNKFTYVKNTQSTFSIRLEVDGTPDPLKVGKVQISSTIIKYVDFEIDDGVYFNFTNTGITTQIYLQVPVLIEYDGTIYETTIIMFNHYTPICIDESIGAYSPFNFEIYNGYGALIYTGMSIKSPSDSFGRVNTARIVDNMLSINNPNFTSNNWYYMNNEYVAVLWSLDDEDVKRLYRFTYDWSYKTKKYTETTLLNRPINNHADYRTPLFVTYLNVLNNADTYKLTIFNNGLGVPKSLPKIPQEGNYAYYIAPDNLSTRTLVRFERNNNVELEYDTKYCADWTLLYVNKFGAIDSFLIEGNLYKTDNYTKNSYKQEVLTTDVNKFGTINYLTSINTTYSFSTNYLTDEQSITLSEHLLPSQIAWLYNNATAEKIPVNITNSSADYKTFKNGKTMVNYIIELQETTDKKIKTLL